MSNDADEARQFAAEHAHYTEDLPLWRAVAQARGGPVLDLGSATGRVALPLAQDGHDVWALDGDRHMLDELGRAAAALGPDVAARVHPWEEDMRSFDVPGPFALVIAAMNTLQVLLEPEDHVACLSCVRRHLAPGGEFWFDVTLPDIADITETMGLVRAGPEYRDAATGERWLHSSWYESYDAVTQAATYALRVDRTSPDGVTRASVRHHTVHLFTPPELRHALALSGLEVLEAWGGFDGEPLDDGAGHQVYRCGVAT